MKKLVIILILWFGLGYVAAGGLYAKMRVESETTARRDRQDAWFCAFYGATGPVGLAAAIVITAGFMDGWKHPPLFGPREESK
jgi:hypothetical protein